MSASELPGAIHDLSVSIVDALESEDLDTIQEPWIRRRYITFGRDEVGGYIHHTEEDEFQKEAWATEEIHEIVEKIREKEIYEECKDLISRRTEEDIDDVDELLESYIRDVVDRSIDDLSERELTNRGSVFVAEIDNSPIYWEGVCWIDGIRLEDSIRLTEEITLREPTEEDMTNEYPARIAELGPPQPPRNAPTAILELSMRTNNSNDTDILRTKILNTLLLYRISSASEIRWRRRSEGYRIRPPEYPEYYNYEISREKMSHLPFSATIEEDEGNELREFYGTLDSKVHDHLIQADEDYLTIAFDRYRSAISDDDSDESGLTSAIMALEALLLGAEGELADKLSRRTGTLLGHFDYNPIKIYRRVKKAYDVRSDYVHGSKIDEDISKLTSRIVNYARMALIIELQLHEEIEKPKLLSKLDRSGLHSEARESMEETLENLIKIEPRE